MRVLGERFGLRSLGDGQSAAERVALTLTTTTTSAGETVTLNETKSASEFEIDWGDGSTDTVAANDATSQTHVYATPGVYTIRFIGAGALDMRELQLRDTRLAGDVSDYSKLINLTYLRLQGGDFVGDVSDYSTISNLTILWLDGDGFVGDVSDYSDLIKLTFLRLTGDGFFGDVSDYSKLINLTLFQLDGDNMTYNTPNVTSLTALSTYIIRMALSTTGVDAILEDVYKNRATFTNAAPSLGAAGSNAAPSGIYQDGDPPTTGKEYAFELVNDPEAEGFNTWTVTYND